MFIHVFGYIVTDCEKFVTKLYSHHGNTGVVFNDRDIVGLNDVFEILGFAMKNILKVFIYSVYIYQRGKICKRHNENWEIADERMISWFY